MYRKLKKRLQKKIDKLVKSEEFIKKENISSALHSTTEYNVRVQKGNYKKVITSKQPIQCNVKQKPSYV